MRRRATKRIDILVPLALSDLNQAILLKFFPRIAQGPGGRFDRRIDSRIRPPEVSAGIPLGSNVWSRWLDADQREDGPLQFLAPMLALAHEHDPNPATRTPAIKSLKKREKIIGAMVLSAMAIYFYFRPHLLKPENADAEPDTDFPARNSGPKVGRNEPCPCGSGKKYKKCCGQPF